jgi:hypothetical protein
VIFLETSFDEPLGLLHPESPRAKAVVPSSRFLRFILLHGQDQVVMQFTTVLMVYFGVMVVEGI